MAVALNGADYDAPADAALRSLAPGGVLVSPDPSILDREFENLAARIAGQSSRTYLLAYCSPKRMGVHTVAVEVKASSTDRPAVSLTFSAENFEAGCSAASFEGLCDDRLAFCDGRHCKSFCTPPLPEANTCGGETITNLQDYEQTCRDVPQATDCGTPSCVDLTRDPSHCGACGNACATDGVTSP